MAKEVSELPAAGAITGNELVPIVQGNTKRATVNAIIAPAIAAAEAAVADEATARAAAVAAEATARAAADAALTTALAGKEPSIPSGTLVQVAGDTMTGPLVLADNAADPLEAVPLQQVETLVASEVASEVAAAVPAEVDAAVASLGLSKEFQNAIALVGGTVSAWDTFQRPDSDLGYTVTPSGHLWRTGTANSGVLVIQGNKFWPLNIPSSAAHIAYLDHSRNMDTVAMEWEWRPGVDDAEDVVIGACVAGFSHGAGGSIQLGIDASGVWRFFAVPSPRLTPYPNLATGTLNLTFDRTGATRYRAVMRRTSASRAVLLLPDGQIITVNDDANRYLETYWPRAATRAGFQLRRPHGSGDGSAVFTSIATGGDAQTSRVAVSLKMLGHASTRVFCQKPSTWTPGNLELIVLGTFSTTATSVLFAHESVDGNQSQQVSISGNTLKYKFYPDGTKATALNYTATTTLPGGYTGIKVTRNATTGDLNFYTSTDDTNWVSVGAMVPTTPGAPYNSTAAFQVVSGGNGCTGTVRSASISDGTAIRASIDCAQMWPHRYVDPYGNHWAIRGHGHQWWKTGDADLPAPTSSSGGEIVPGAIITSDSFSGADIANINGRSMDLVIGGSARTWTQVSGTTLGLSIVSGQIVRQATGATRRYYVIGGASPDMYSSILVATKPNSGLTLNLCVRAHPSGDSFHSVRISGSSAQLCKQIAGVQTLLGSSATLSGGETVAIRVTGDQLELVVNGELRSTVTIDPAELLDTQTGGGLNLPSTVTGFVLDDFVLADV